MVAPFGEFLAEKTVQIGTYTPHKRAEHAKHDPKRPKDAKKLNFGPLLVPKCSIWGTKIEAKTDLNTKTPPSLKCY